MANMAPLMSSYGMGFANGVSIRGMPLLSAYPGNVFWVDSVNGADGNNGTFQYPFATVSKAVSFCTAARGDIIVCKAGHVETISSATSLLMTISSVAVVGLGTGNHRPKFNYTTADTAAIVVSADNVSFTNCQFTSSFLSVARAITLTTAKFFTLQSCTFIDTAAATDFLQCVVGTGGANTTDGLTVTDCQWFGLGVTSVLSFCTLANANDQVSFLRNRFITERTGDFPVALIVTTGASTNIEFGNNVTISKQTASTLGILAGLGASSTGVAYNNYAGSLVTASDILFTTTVGIFPFENRVSGVVGKTGFVIPAVDS
jgi:hypothetical protein